MRRYKTRRSVKGLLALAINACEAYQTYPGLSQFLFRQDEFKALHRLELPAGMAPF
jgi:hypothetical protein